MSNNFGVSKYKQASVTTASRGQLLIMLYETAIRNLKHASEAIRTENIELKGQCIIKVHDILNELVNTLNFEVESSIPQDLERLYNYMLEQLVKANIENSTEILTFIQNMLEDLLASWKVAVEQVNKGQV
jgi:flagellar protein FliS